jgi:hypothetical protein
MSFTRDDFPDPLTPVTAVSTPSGKSAVTLRRLFSFAPTTLSMRLRSIRRRFFGVRISRRPAR